MKKKRLLLSLLLFAGIIFLLVSLVWGKDLALFNPKGLIAQRQFYLMMFVGAALLAIAVPTLVFLYFIAWKYRESNKKAPRDPHVHYGKFFKLGLWMIPSVVVLVLTSVMWPAAHELDPHQVIAADVKPLIVQVIAMRWKWLFIYPEQNIASVNFVQLPTNTPVEFDLTADEAPMNSFWIPHLGGQLYAMTGHENRLNLMAGKAGDYTGQAAEINGAGFSDMKFVARASSSADFDRWVQNLQQSSETLDDQSYQKLLIPSINNSITHYAVADTGLYGAVLAKYGGPEHVHPEQE